MDTILPAWENFMRTCLIPLTGVSHMGHYLYLGAAAEQTINMSRAQYVVARVRMAEYLARAKLTNSAKAAIDKMPLTSSQKARLKQTPIEGVLELMNPIEGKISGISQNAYARANPMAKQAVDKLPRPIDPFTRRLYNAIRFMILAGMDPVAMGLAMASFGLPSPGQVMNALLTGGAAAVNRLTSAGTTAITAGRTAVTDVLNQFGLNVRGVGNLGHYAYLGAAEASSDSSDPPTMGNDPNYTAGAQPDPNVTSPPAGDASNGGNSPTVTDPGASQNSGDKETAKKSGALAMILGALLAPDMIKLLLDLMKVGMLTTVSVASGGRIGGQPQSQQPQPQPQPQPGGPASGPGIMDMKIAGLPLPLVAGGVVVALLLLKK